MDNNQPLQDKWKPEQLRQACLIDERIWVIWDMRKIILFMVVRERDQGLLFSKYLGVNLS
jgi:hypothetical protein